MQTRAPSPARIVIAVAFALSCFGLLLFLWVTFGGPVPLKAQSYRFTAYFPEATQLSVEADVRISGVSVGKVKKIEVGPSDVRIGGKDVTAATIEIDSKFAPISSDAKAILRQKTLLGETYVELTPGTTRATPVALGGSDAEPSSAEPLDDGGTLGVGQVEEATQVDEIFNAYDPATRRASKRLTAGIATSLRGRGLDLNDALGNFGPFIDDAATITHIVRRQRGDVERLIRNSGAVLDAISRDEGDLAGAITGSEETLGGLADANQPLAETVQILPTFEREARLTLARLDRLQRNARPVVRALLPVASDFSPTLRSLRRLSPPLRGLLSDVDPLLDAARRGLPSTRAFLHGLGPTLDALDPFLANLNPVLRYLRAYRFIATAFLAGPPLGTTGTLPYVPGQPTPRHYLRALTYTSPETLSVYPVRVNTNRGNAYVQPRGYIDHPSELTFESFDCKNTDYTGASTDPDDEERHLGDNGSPKVGYDYAPCISADNFPSRWGGKKAPQVGQDR